MRRYNLIWSSGGTQQMHGSSIVRDEQVSTSEATPMPLPVPFPAALTATLSVPNTARLFSTASGDQPWGAEKPSIWRCLSLAVPWRNASVCVLPFDRASAVALRSCFHRLKARAFFPPGG